MNKIKQNAHFLLRLSLAATFLYHGLGKFPVLEHFAEMIKMPTAIALLVALMEVIGGILILIGGFTNDTVTRIGAALIIPIMLVVILFYHWGQWSFLPSKTHPTGGIEFQTMITATALYLLIKGNKT